MAAKSTPRPWVRLDTGFLADDNVRELGDSCGAGGVLVLVALILTAKSAALAGAPVDRQGQAAMRWRSLARAAFVTIEAAQGAVRTLDALGVVEVAEDDGQRLTVRLLKWSSWEPQDSAGAARQARYRARKRSEEPADGQAPGACW